MGIALFHEFVVVGAEIGGRDEHGAAGACVFVMPGQVQAQPRPVEAEAKRHPLGETMLEGEPEATCGCLPLCKENFDLLNM